ncbi:MAG: hypothetical protein KatS3mg032_0221 [Cyclobacteriaceae bacterium]|nr:MAG: hypothetical protein KatS3mg032_0221 [Cyclobacteriaceae bacterium]
MVPVMLAAGCRQEELPAPQVNYFPLETGTFWEYRVEEVTYSPFAAPSANSYLLRTVVVDSTRSSAGDYIYILHRFSRPDANSTWQFLNTWSARLYNGYALITEGNTTYVKLAFPVYVNRTWNGNLFNSLDEDSYRITRQIAGEELSTGLRVNDIAEVEQENVTNNLTYRDVRKEWYARNMGLVYKESEVWTYRCGGGTCSGEIESGYSLRQTLTAFGRE